jgi:hypothetical protein
MYTKIRYKNLLKTSFSVILLATCLVIPNHGFADSNPRKGSIEDLYRLITEFDKYTTEKLNQTFELWQGKEIFSRRYPKKLSDVNVEALNFLLQVRNDLEKELDSLGEKYKNKRKDKYQTQKIPCKYCDGTGQTMGRKCLACKGTGNQTIKALDKEVAKELKLMKKNGRNLKKAKYNIKKEIINVLYSGAKGRPLNPLTIRNNLKQHLEPIENIYSPRLDKFVDKVMKYKIKKSKLIQKNKDKKEQEGKTQTNSKTNNKIKALRIKADIIELKEKLKNETSEAQKLRLQADILEKEEELKSLE